MCNKMALFKNSYNFGKIEYARLMVLFSYRSENFAVFNDLGLLNLLELVSSPENSGKLSPYILHIFLLMANHLND